MYLTTHQPPQPPAITTPVASHLTGVAPDYEVAQKTPPESTISGLVTTPTAVTNTRLIIEDRSGNSQQFTLKATPQLSQKTAEPVIVEIENISVVEVKADRQEYDAQRQVITAEGNVLIRFQGAVLRADRLQVNLPNRLAVADGNVSLKRGEQVLRGDRFQYFFFQDRGTIFQARGEVYQPSYRQDLDLNLPTDINAATGTIQERGITNRLLGEQPITGVTAEEGYGLSIGGSTARGAAQIGLPDTGSGGQINRFRFEAEKIDFDAQGWQASNISLTNDPFSPPELELRADTAQFQSITPEVSELRTTGSRVVLDRRLSLPIFQDRLVISNRPRKASLLQLGYDDEDRGGLFVQRQFSAIDTQKLQWTVTPQYFLEKALSTKPNQEGSGEVISPQVFGLKNNVNVDFSQRTNLRVSTALTSFDLDEIDDKLRASIRLRQRLGNLEQPYNLNLEYSYRDRLFNGSLGFQTVRSSIGTVLTSPVFALGSSGVNLSYQVGIQNINSDTDREDLLRANRDNNRVNLTRYQGALSLNRSFPLWRGQPLAATATEGLRYTPRPVVPYFQFLTGLTGVGSLYSNSDTQKPEEI